MRGIHAHRGPARRVAGLLLLAFLAALATCRLGEPGMSTPIVISGDSFTLAWDPAPAVPGSEVVTWRVSFRPHGTSAWTELEEMPADEGTRCTITRDELGDGAFDMAVSAVDSLGRESAPHSSTDTDAWPVGGWYLLWQG